MTLNGVMAITLCYFTKFGKLAFQHVTASAHIELADQKSASITQHKTIKFACVTKCTDSRWIRISAFALPLLSLF